MILYTAIPLELVVEGIEKGHNYKELELSGIKLLVEPVDVDRSRIVRIISTNPQDYLNPRLSPGTIIEHKI